MGLSSENGEKIIALAGNPNVGKSTIFNGLTGLNQHTGNWTGKTVDLARGYVRGREKDYIIVDLPGAYSLMAHSFEEEIARDFICFDSYDTVLIVCDATCLERNMNLLLQTLEITKKAIVCVNLLDEAKGKGIKVDTKRLSKILGVPVVGTVGRKKKSISAILEVLDKSADLSENTGYSVDYGAEIEKALSEICENISGEHYLKRFVALRLLEGNYDFAKRVADSCLLDIKAVNIPETLPDKERISEIIVEKLVESAEKICSECVSVEKSRNADIDRRLDRIFTGKYTAFPIMILFFAFIFWLTITGANYPSALLSEWLFALEDKLMTLCRLIHMPDFLTGVLVSGAYRVSAWVVSVMLPPMAIFFPLFTLLEDAGYLPRIAYNLDRPFKKCNACGKQALTICMGFGCNAAGVVGCRIIDSPRERLLAIITNSLVPCNGRFPTLIALITMFFAIGTNSLVSSLMLTSLVIFGVLMTFVLTKLLSETLLKGEPSFFTFELPSYRRPQIGKVIVRSILDRTIYVLGRSVAVAAPAGALIWIFANINIGGVGVLSHISSFLEPFGRLMGLDGVILLGFILGLPANEIVLPIIFMIYTKSTSLTEISSLTAFREVLLTNGWNSVTAINVMLFSLFHFPCSTTLLTIKKESGSVKWMIVSALLPTLVGIIVCTAVNLIFG